MDILEAIGKPAEYIVAILVLLGFVLAGVKYVPKGYRRLRSWKIVKRDEYTGLKTIEAEHQKCRPELERLHKFEKLQEFRVELHPSAATEPFKPTMKFDPRFPNRK
jgi:hypothetical protein